MRHIESVLIACAVGGCSLAFVSPPPLHATASSDCSKSHAAPIADAAIATIGAVGAIALLSASGHNCDPYDNNCVAFGPSGSDLHTAGAVMLIPTAIYALSAYRGFSATHECRALASDHGPAVAD